MIGCLCMVIWNNMIVLAAYLFVSGCITLFVNMTNFNFQLVNDMECFQYEIASTVIKCCNFVKQNVFVQLPKQWNWNFICPFFFCLYYVLCVFLLFRHTLFYMCFPRSAIQVRQRRRTGFPFSLELDDDEIVGSLRTSSMRAFLVPPSGFTFGW